MDDVSRIWNLDLPQVCFDTLHFDFLISFLLLVCQVRIVLIEERYRIVGK